MRTWLFLLLVGCSAAPSRPDLRLDNGAAAIIPGPVGDLEVRGWNLRPGGRPVLLVHGLLGSAAYWQDRAPFIAALGRPVIAVSLRGRGGSAAPTEARGYHPEAQAQDLLAALDAVGARDAHVVAHSMGVPVALAFYQAHRNRVATMTVGDYPPGWVQLTPAWLKNAPARPDIPADFAPAIVADQAHWGAGGTRVQFMPNQVETLLPNYQRVAERLKVPTQVFLGRESAPPMWGMLWWAAGHKAQWLPGGHAVFDDSSVGPSLREAWDAWEAE